MTRTPKDRRETERLEAHRGLATLGDRLVPLDDFRRASAAAGDEPATTNDALIVSSWVSLRARDVVLASRARGPARINLRGTIDVVTSTPSRELARARIRGRVEIPPGPSCPVKIPPPHR